MIPRNSGSPTKRMEPGTMPNSVQNVGLRGTALSRPVARPARFAASQATPDGTALPARSSLPRTCGRLQAARSAAKCPCCSLG